MENVDMLIVWAARIAENYSNHTSTTEVLAALNDQVMSGISIDDSKKIIEERYK